MVNNELKLDLYTKRCDYRSDTRFNIILGRKYIGMAESNLSKYIVRAESNLSKYIRMAKSNLKEDMDDITETEAKLKSALNRLQSGMHSESNKPNKSLEEFIQTYFAEN